MEDNSLNYKGYKTLIHFNATDQVLYGKLEGITDLVSFEADTIAGIYKSFQEAVDDYITTLKELNGKDA